MEKREQWRQYGFVIQQLTSRELKRKYARSVLGVLWSVLNPLLSMAVLSPIFSRMFMRSIENYPIYYLTGTLLWQAFAGTTTASVTTLADNRPLLLKVKFPMELFLLTRGCAALINLGYSLIAYGVLLAVFRVPLGWAALTLFPVVLFLFLFSLGVSFLLAAAYVFFGDVKHLYSVALTLWMYCSAIFYPVEQLRPHAPCGGGKPPLPVHRQPAGCGAGAALPQPLGHAGHGGLGSGHVRPGGMGVPGPAGKNLPTAVKEAALWAARQASGWRT